MSNHLSRSSYYYWKKFLLEIIINNIPSIFKRKKKKKFVTARVPLQHALQSVACPKTKRLDRAIFRRKRRVIFANTFVDGYELGAGVSRKRIEFHLPLPPRVREYFRYRKKKTVISPFIRRNGAIHRPSAAIDREGSTRD